MVMKSLGHIDGANFTVQGKGASYLIHCEELILFPVEVNAHIRLYGFSLPVYQSTSLPVYQSAVNGVSVLYVRLYGKM